MPTSLPLYRHDRPLGILLTHVVAQNISEETAFEVASSAHDFKLMLAAQGQRASGIEQVTGNGDDAEGSLHFVKR